MADKIFSDADIKQTLKVARNAFKALPQAVAQSIDALWILVNLEQTLRAGGNVFVTFTDDPNIDEDGHQVQDALDTRAEDIQPPPALPIAAQQDFDDGHFLAPWDVPKGKGKID